MPTVTEIQEDAQTYATQLGDQMATLIAELLALKNITSPAFGPEITFAGHTFYDNVSQLAQDILSTIPERAAVEEPSVVAPNAPTVTIDTPSAIVVPQFSGGAPSLEIPAAPAFTLPADPAGAPALNIPAIPESPSYDLPDVPTFQTLIVPPAPNVQIPAFTGTAPNTTLTPPTNTFAFAETPYVSELLDTVGDKLLTDLTEGGYGIETVDELMLLDRAHERESEAAARAIDEASRQFAARRFDLPPGALLETISRAHEANQAASNTLSREIVLKRYDLIVQARQFAIQNGVQLENVLMSFHGARMERILNAARYTAEAAISFFNAEVERVKVEQARYETEARVFEILIRAKVEELNVYRAQLEAEKMKGEIDRIKIEQYRAELDGVRIAAEIFNTRMRAAEIQASVERVKIEGYRASIDAYIANVKAREAKLSAYEATVRGQLARAQVFETEVRAYAEQVRGKVAESEIATARVRAQAEKAQAEVALFNARSQNYRTQLDGELDVQKLLLSAFNADISAFQARASAAAEISRLGIANFQANTADFLGVLRYNLDKAATELRKFEADRTFQGEIIAKGIAAYGPLASAALSSINTLASQTTTE